MNDKKEDIENNKSFLRETVETVVFVLVAVIIIRFFLGELRWIPSGSMKPTLIEHDRVFVERLTHWHRKPKRGDVLVFYPPMEILSKRPFAIFARLTGIFCKDIAYIKRVIATPGDKFEIKTDDKGRSYVYINDEKLEEPYIMSDEYWPECDEYMYCGPLTIPEGHYFMMGDNRGSSMDSRFWGFLPEERIIGRAIFVFWPLWRIKGL